MSPSKGQAGGWPRACRHAGDLASSLRPRGRRAQNGDEVITSAEAVEQIGPGPDPDVESLGEDCFKHLQNPLRAYRVLARHAHRARLASRGPKRSQHVVTSSRLLTKRRRRHLVAGCTNPASRKS